MFLLLTSAVLAASFTWIGASGDTWRAWQTTTNWISACVTCYPDDSSDNATITVGANGNNIELQQSETIGQFIVKGGPSSIGFRSEGSETNTLTVDRGEFDATNEDLFVTFKAGFKVTTN